MESQQEFFYRGRKITTARTNIYYGCEGCVFAQSSCEALRTAGKIPDCRAKNRSDNTEVIFIDAGS